MSAAAARALFASDDAAAWAARLAQYDACLAAQPFKTPEARAEMLALDAFWREAFPAAVRARQPPSMTKEELVQVMTWKLRRGKHRPLLALVHRNSAAAVAAASAKAFGLLLPAAAAVEPPSPATVTAALEALCALHGVGPATASALLAPLCPAAAPFMADEAVEAVPGLAPIKYTAAHYARFAEACRRCAAALACAAAADPPVAWTAEAVGRALWVAAKMPSPAAPATAEPVAKRPRQG